MTGGKIRPAIRQVRDSLSTNNQGNVHTLARASAHAAGAMSRPASAAPRRPAEEANVKVVVRCRCASLGFLADGASRFSERGIAKRPRLTDRAPPDPARPRPTRRPLNAAERASNAAVAVTANPSRREIVVAAPEPASGPGASSHASAVSGGKPGATTGAAHAASKTYTFDGVFGPDATQTEVYAHAIEPIVAETLEGFNCTVFAYGQTGTGKTHTMEGDDSSSETRLGSSDGVAETAGIVPRALRQIFSHLETQSETEYSVRCTFLELYNEEITDLLSPLESKSESSPPTESESESASAKKTHRLMEDGRGGVSVEGLTEVEVSCFAEALALARAGSARRKKAATKCNAHSSRSHSVFSVATRSRQPSRVAGEEGEDLIKLGKLNLVDLAGSENVGKSGVAERGATARSREAGEINKSLLTLGRVVTALVDKLAHVPYRDSKLTRLLRDALGGKSKTCILATVGMASAASEETVATAEYAARARSVRCKPEVNRRVTRNALARELRLEIETLRRDLDATRLKNGVYVARETHAAEQAKKTEREEKVRSLQNALHEAEANYVEATKNAREASERFANESAARAAEAEARVRAAAAAAAARENELATRFESESARISRDAEREKSARLALETQTKRMVVRRDATATETVSLFAARDRASAREKETVSALAETSAAARDAAARLENAEAAVALNANAWKEKKKMKKREKAEKRRALHANAFETASREIQRARDAATRACDDALAALGVAFAETHRLENASESEEESPDAEALAEELAAAAAAARAALAAAAAVSVPDDMPSGATPTRATATALAPPTPEDASFRSRASVEDGVSDGAANGVSDGVSNAAATESPERFAAAAEMRATRAKTSSLPRAPLRDLGENVEEAA